MNKQAIEKITFVVCTLLMMSVVFTVQAQTPTPDPNTLLQDCEHNLRADRPLSSGADAPSIKIIAPDPHTVIIGDQPKFVAVTFSVEVQNWTLPGTSVNENAPHWHLWLNNTVWEMFYGTEAQTSIPYGTWRVCATLSDANHNDIGIPDAILLTAKRGDSPTPTITVQPTPPAVSADKTTSQSLPIPVIAALGLIALLIGYVFGRRNANKSP